MESTDVPHLLLSQFDTLLVTSKWSKEFSFKWTLNNFSELPADKELEKSLEIMPGHSCKLFLQSGPENVSMTLENNSKYNLTPEIELSIFDIEGIRWHYQKTFKCIESGVKTFILNSDKSKYSDLLRLKDDICILVCHFKINEFLTTATAKPRSNSGRNYDGRLKLCADLKVIRDDACHIDVALNVGGGKVLANKAFLSSRSPTFQTMFHDSKEDNFQIDDVERPVLQKLVDFLYVGELKEEINFRSATALYIAADKFKVLDLRQMVAETMLSMLTPDNFTEVVVTADRHEDNYLKNGTMAFICQNFNVVIKSKSWEEFVNHETRIAAQVVRYCSRRIKFQPETV